MAIQDDDLSDVKPSLDGLDHIVGLHVALAHGAIYRNFMETFSNLELTQRQVTCLWLVGDFPGISQIDIAQLLTMDRATTMAVINRLQAKGLIMRGKSPSDGRRQTLKLTRTGKSTLAEAKGMVAAHEEWLKGRFSAREIKSFVDILKRIHE